MKNPYKLIEEDDEGETSDEGICYILAKEGNKAIVLSLPRDKFECYCLEFVRLSNHHRVAFRTNSSKEFINLEAGQLLDISKLIAKLNKNNKKLKKKLDDKWRNEE